MDQAEARRRALAYVNSRYHVPGDEIVILDEFTRVTDYGWVFFSSSRRYVETRNVFDMPAGNGPVVVERETGAVVRLPSNKGPDELIRDYEAARGGGRE